MFNGPVMFRDVVMGGKLIPDGPGDNVRSKLSVIPGGAVDSLTTAKPKDAKIPKNRIRTRKPTDLFIIISTSIRRKGF